MIIVHTVDNDELLIDPQNHIFSRVGTGCAIADTLEELQEDIVYVLKESLEDIQALMED